MKIVLNPLDDASMQVVGIEDELFAIGRREEPFASQPEDKVGRLSRRHARIFVEQGRSFITDCGSLNGTFVNQQRLGEDAVALQSGDEINLGGEYRFKVEIENDPTNDQTAAARPLPASVTLLPAQSNPLRQPIVVTGFPFLISRKSPPFTELDAENVQSVKQISRRHAVFVLKGGCPHVEDLESANGTFVNGERLDERSRAVHNGEVISFGGRMFEYKLEIEIPDDDRTVTVPRNPPRHGSPESTLRSTPQSSATADNVSTNPESPDLWRTRYVDEGGSGTSFLDVFLRENGVDSETPGEEISDRQTADGQRQKSKMSVTAAALVSALGGRIALNRKVVLAAALSVLLVVGIVSFVYVSEAGQRTVVEHYDAGDYAQSAELANRLLASSGKNEVITRVGERAMLMSVMPEWLSRLRAGQYAQAKGLLEEADAAFPAIPRGSDMLEVLGWAGEINEHIARRPDRETPLEMFKDEIEIHLLVTRWDTNEQRYLRLSRQMSAYEPVIAAFMAETMSGLRMLREQNSVYGPAIASLKKTLSDKLVKGDTGSATTSIGQFVNAYPNIHGVDELREDVETLDRIVRLQKKSEVVALVQARQSIVMKTPFVTGLALTWLDSVLPDELTQTKFIDANRAWQEGDSSRAVEVLQAIDAPAWLEASEQQIHHIDRVNESFAQLQAHRNEADYGDQLIAFWNTLSTSDEYFRAALADDFKVQEERLQETIDAQFVTASNAWQAYQQAGGIKGIMRLSEPITVNYREQAELLSSAHSASSNAIRMAESLQRIPAIDQQTIHEQITREVARQRRWIRELNLVLNSDLVDAKLALLPEVQEESL